MLFWPIPAPKKPPSKKTKRKHWSGRIRSKNIPVESRQPLAGVGYTLHWIAAWVGRRVRIGNRLKNVIFSFSSHHPSPKGWAPRWRPNKPLLKSSFPAQPETALVQLFSPAEAPTPKWTRQTGKTMSHCATSRNPLRSAIIAFAGVDFRLGPLSLLFENGGFPGSQVHNGNNFHL